MKDNLIEFSLGFAYVGIPLSLGLTLLHSIGDLL